MEIQYQWFQIGWWKKVLSDSGAKIIVTGQSKAAWLGGKSRTLSYGTLGTWQVCVFLRVVSLTLASVSLPTEWRSSRVVVYKPEHTSELPGEGTDEGPVAGHYTSFWLDRSEVGASVPPASSLVGEMRLFWGEWCNVSVIDRTLVLPWNPPGPSYLKFSLPPKHPFPLLLIQSEDSSCLSFIVDYVCPKVHVQMAQPSLWWWGDKNL